VARIWRRWGLQPVKAETFKFSTDPELEAKIRDVVGLFLDPPAGAVVVCIDEIQALDRTAPILPLRPGMPEKQTHDYKRNGTTALIAALEVATGLAGDSCYQQHQRRVSGVPKAGRPGLPPAARRCHGSDPSNPGVDNRHPAPATVAIGRDDGGSLPTAKEHCPGARTERGQGRTVAAWHLPPGPACVRAPAR
jgi:hypothetical protein